MDGVDVSDRLWRLTAEHSPVGMTLVSTEGRFLAVNAALCAMLGRDAETLRSLTFQEITHPDDLALDLGMLAELLAGERTSYRMVKRFFDADGGLVWGDLSVAVVRDDDQTPLHLVSQIIDVTQQQHDRAHLARTEARLDRQLRRVEAIYDTVDVGLVLIDAEGRYESMNRYHEALMAIGFPDGHDGVAGQLGEVYAEDARTPLTREQMPTWRATRGDEFDDLRLWIGAVADERRALSVSARSVHDGEGRFTGAALVYKDVTDYLHALTVKDEFLASVSHELRTPLTSVLGHLEMLADAGDLGPAAQKKVEVVRRNATRLHGLVSDLLEVSRWAGGGLRVTRVETDLSALVEQAAEAARPAARAAGLELLTDLPATLVADVDAGRLRQVVDNLVSNAVKYSDPGGTVRVGAAPYDGGVELVVADTGMGIGAEEVERLFTRFFRGGEAHRRQIPGTGLGLVIVRSIVEAHGGTVGLTSRPGVGTTVTVRLPRPLDRGP